MMAIVEQYNLQKTAPLLFQGKTLRIEMVRSDDSYILQIDKWVNVSDNATDKIIFELALKKVAKERFELILSRRKI
jgi:hypothetical protein